MRSLSAVARLARARAAELLELAEGLETWRRAMTAAYLDPMRTLEGRNRPAEVA